MLTKMSLKVVKLKKLYHVILLENYYLMNGGMFQVYYEYFFKLKRWK